MINLQQIKLVRPFFKHRSMHNPDVGACDLPFGLLLLYSSWSFGCKHQSNADGPESGSQGDPRKIENG